MTFDRSQKTDVGERWWKLTSVSKDCGKQNEYWEKGTVGKPCILLQFSYYADLIHDTRSAADVLKTFQTRLEAVVAHRAG